MSVDLSHHTIVDTRKNRESAEFPARVRELEVGAEWGALLPAALGGGVTPKSAALASQAVAAQAIGKNHHHGGRGSDVTDPAGYGREIAPSHHGSPAAS